MRIGFFVINNIIGGGGMVATENAINIIRQHHDVILFLEDIIDEKSKHLFNLGNVKYIKVGKISEYNNIKKLFDELKKNSIDIFVTHCHYYFNIIKLFPGIRELGIKVILNEHHYHFIPVYEKRIDLYLNRKEYLNSCNLITTIEKTSYAIWKSEGYNVAYLPNTYISNQKHIRLTKQKTVIMAGRFTDFKQIHLGILAFSLACMKYRDWKLIILGKGPEQKNIIDTIKSSGITANVKVIPWTSDPERYFAEASIHLLPSYTEPFGLVIADAKVNHIPTVMFDLKSNGLVRDGIDGFRVPFGSVEKMAKALEKLMSSPTLRNQMGQVAAESLEQNKPEYTIKVWNEIFNYVMKKNIIDEEIYNNHFKSVFTSSDVDALIYDYNSLIKWNCIKNDVHHKERKNTHMPDRVYKKIRTLYRNKINSIGKIVFNVVQKFFKCNYVILWDSNGAGFMQECLEGKFRLPTKVIIPKSSLFSPLRAYYLARAKVFITNTNTPYIKMLLSKNSNIPYIINIWHACGYFKKFGIHENNIGLLAHRKKFGTPSFVLCSSKKIRDKYADIFGVNFSNILPFGIPRTDLLYNSQLIENRKEKFYSLYPELKNKKIYFMAPTWRGEPFKGETAFYTPQLDFSQVANLLKEDEIILIKNHQLVIKNKKRDPSVCNIKYIDNKIVCVDNIDIITLTIVCDVFITDFSSAYFEALILNKPIVFYADDIEVYRTKIGFYDNYENYCPGGLCSKPDSKLFIKEIRNSYKYIHGNKYKKIKDKFISACDGNSSKRLIDFVNNLDLTDYVTLWKKYVKKIYNVNDALLIFTKDFSRKFYIIYIRGLDHSIHFELLYRKGKRYLCLHFENQKYNTPQYIDFLNSFSKHYTTQITTNKLEVSCMVNINTVRHEFIELLSLVKPLLSEIKQ